MFFGLVAPENLKLPSATAPQRNAVAAQYLGEKHKVFVVYKRSFQKPTQTGLCSFVSLFPALTPAHLFRRLRAAMALHPIFSAAASAPDILSPAFPNVRRHSPMTYEIL